MHPTKQHDYQPIHPHVEIDIFFPSTNGKRKNKIMKHSEDISIQSNHFKIGDLTTLKKKTLETFFKTISLVNDTDITDHEDPIIKEIVRMLIQLKPTIY